MTSIILILQVILAGQPVVTNRVPMDSVDECLAGAKTFIERAQKEAPEGAYAAGCAIVLPKRTEG